MSTDAGFDSRATRVAPWGTERAFFLGEPGDRVFGVVHAPTADPVGAVLVCPSLFTDTIFNYRREVEVSRILAAEGLIVGRFHFRGTGHSEGDPLATTFPTMVSDALRMAEHLDDLDGGARLGVLGSRWGSLVAAGLGARFQDAPIALWEPIVTGEAFLREALQASGVAHMASRLDGASPTESLAANGVANILGFPMGRALFESGEKLSLVDLFGTAARQVLYLGPGRQGNLTTAHLEAVEDLRSNGVEVDARVITGPRAWWFVDEVNPTPVDAAETTAHWFEAALARSA